MRELQDYTKVLYFIKVAECGNISRAAEELFVSQPSLSRHIGRMEDEIGLELFSRTKRGMELTEDGKLYYDQCKKLERAFDEYYNAISLIRGHVVGELKIGYQSMTKKIVTDINAKVHEQYPLIRMFNVRQSKENFVDGLISGELDLAFLYEHEIDQREQKLESVHITSFQKMLVVSKKHPLAAREKIHIRELEKEYFIQTSRETSPVKHREFLHACRNNGFEPNVFMYVNTLNEALVDVITYNMVSIMPYYEDSDSLRDEVVFLELEGMETEYPISLVWMKEGHSSVIGPYLKILKEEYGIG